jgi:ABC-2 type transport system permease protein
MRVDVVLLDLRLRRRSLIGLTVGMALYTLVVVALYPQFKDAANLNQLSGSTAAALFGVTGSLTSPTGWLNGNIYQNFLPLIMLLITIGYGASCIAGQDEDGTLALVATLSVSRRDFLFQKAATMIIQAGVLSLGTAVCVIIGRRFDMSIDLTHVVGMSLGLTLLGVDFGLLALAVGAWSGSRGLALAIAAGLAAASYLLSSLAPVVAWIRPARYASLFFWSIGNGQLEKGLGGVSLGVLVLIGVVLLVASAAGLDRLDLH